MIDNVCNICSFFKDINDNANGIMAAVVSRTPVKFGKVKSSMKSHKTPC